MIYIYIYREREIGKHIEIDAYWVAVLRKSPIRSLTFWHSAPKSSWEIGTFYCEREREIGKQIEIDAYWVPFLTVTGSRIPRSTSKRNRTNIKNNKNSNNNNDNVCKTMFNKETINDHDNGKYNNDTTINIISIIILLLL